jgi:hypothetical protein
MIKHWNEINSNQLNRIRAIVKYRIGIIFGAVAKRSIIELDLELMKQQRIQESGHAV